MGKVNMLKVLFNKILVKVDAAEERVGSLYAVRLVDDVGPVWGRVTQVGPGNHTDQGVFISTTIKEGDRVLFNTFDSAEFKSGGTTFRVLPETSVLAVETSE